jgi:hypothetical protein
VEVGPALDIVLSVLFLAAGAHKLIAPVEWRLALRAYEVAWIGRIPAAFLPALEVGTGVALAAGLHPVGPLAASALSLSFVFVLTWAYAHGARGDCGCFGDALPTSIGPTAIVRGLGMLAASLFALMSEVAPFGIGQIVLSVVGALALLILGGWRKVTSA